MSLIGLNRSLTGRPLAFWLSLLLLWGAAAVNAATAPTNGLVARYEFSGNYLDTGGRNLHGQNPLDAPLTTDRYGRTNRALALNGSSSLVQITENPVVLNLTNSLTLSTWIYPASPARAAAGGDQVVIARKSPQGTAYQLGYRLGVGPQQGKISLHFLQGTPASRLEFSPSSLLPNAWNHVAITRTGNGTSLSGVRLYMNGSEVGSDSGGILAKPSSVTDIPTTIGYYYSAMDGRVDDVRIYNTTLTAPQVSDLYSAELTLAAPTLGTITNRTILEDAALQNVALTGITSGADEIKITAFSSNTNLIPHPTIFYASPNPTGSLSFRPLPNANGTNRITVTVTDNGGTANGRTNAVSKTFTVVVTPVNDPPHIEPIGDRLVLRNAGLQTVLLDIDAGVDKSGNLSRLTAESMAPALVPNPETILPIPSRLTFTPVAGMTGSATIRVVLSDNDGTANGGIDKTTNFFTVYVVTSNQPPTVVITAPPQDTNHPPATPVVISVLAKDDLDPVGGGINAVVFRSDNLPFATNKVSPFSWIWTNPPAGEHTLIAVATDTGGINATSAPVKFKVLSPNQAPSFVKGPDVVVNENAGPRVQAGWATQIKAGPTNESLQALEFLLTNINTNLFSAGPSLSANGTLTFTPARDANGTNVITVALKDSGDTKFGGTNTSATQSFRIVVNPVNQAPSFVLGRTNLSVYENSGVQVFTNWASQISAGPPDETSQTLSFLLAPSRTNLFSADPSLGTNGTLTFRLAKDANGSATISVLLQDSGDGVNFSATQRFTITVDPVNSAPSFSLAVTNAVVNESAGPQSFTNWATAIYPGAADEVTQKLEFRLNYTATNLFAAPPLVDPNGTLTFTPAPNSNGTASVTLYLHDDGGTNNGGVDTSVAQSFSINVRPVNQAPSFLLTRTNLTVYENAGLQTLTNWATNLSAGPPNEATQGLTFVLANSLPGLFTTLPQLTTDGVLTFAAAPNANGSNIVTVVLQDSGDTQFGGTNASPSQQFTITVSPVNSAPSFSLAVTNAVVNESAGPQSFTNWATAIHPGAADERGQKLEFRLNYTATNLFSAPPLVDPNGTLTFTPAPNSNGTASVTLYLHDDGGTNNGGVDTSVAQSFSIVVDPVNQAPTFGFVQGANITVPQNSGPFTATHWATGISPGPADEMAQTLAFLVVTNSNPALFAMKPTLSPDGSVSFTPAIDASGFAVISVVLRDSGGTDHGGNDTSPARSFTIAVTAVTNQPPTFALAQTNVVVLENAGPQAFTDWATAIFPGATNEGAQQLDFVLTNSRPELFAVLPELTTNGVLTFTPTTNANGVAHLGVVLKDNGAGTSGGRDTSDAQTFTITILAVNQPPEFVKGPDLGVEANAGPQVHTNWATGIIAGPTNEVDQHLTFKLTSDSPALFSVQPALNSNGTLTFTPVPGAEGAATMTVVLRDDAGTENGGQDTSPPQSFRITIVRPLNQPPTLGPIFDLTIPEDAGKLTVSLSGIGSGASNELQTLSVTATSTATNLFSKLDVSYISPQPTGRLTFEPRPNANGTNQITVTVSDNGGLDGVSRTFTVTILAINDAPSFVAGGNLSANTESGPQTITNWATAITTGPANELDQHLTFILTNDRPALFSAQPTLNTNGTLTYTPALGANGTATVSVILQDDGGTGPGDEGQDTSPPQQFTIAVESLNQPPTIDAINDLGILEDEDEITLALTGIGAGGSDANQALTVSATSSLPGLIPHPRIAYTSPRSTGFLRFKPLRDANGTARITVTVTDSGGTANGGQDQTIREFFLTVSPVNDAPSFMKGGDVTVNENAGPQSLTNWASAILPGPANESGQILGFLLTADNAALFSVPPTLDTNGTLTFTPATNAYGVANLTAVLRDDGGTEDAGENTSPGQSFTITILPINQPPSLDGIGAVSILEDAPVQAVSLTGISSGASNEVQVLTVTTESSNPDLIPNPGVVYTNANPTGALTFQPLPNAFGSATITVTVSDDGGIDNGGRDKTIRSFLVTVAPVNDSPTLEPPDNRTLRVNAPTQEVTLTGITSGATNEIQALSLTAVSDNLALIPNPAITHVSPGATGTLRFQPVQGQSGTAVITVTVQDDGGTADGGIDRFSRQFRVDVQANFPPTAVVTGLANGASFDAPANLLLRADASDGDGTIAKVEFFQNGKPLGQVTTAPYELSWSPVPAGQYAISVRATDNDGATTDSAPVNIAVRESLTLNLTSPVAGARYCPDAPLVLAASTSGAVPAGSRVEFLLDGQFLARAETVPFTVLRREGLPSGDHEVRALLIDAQGAQRAETSSVRFTVLDTCADVAVLRNYADPEADAMAELLAGDDLRAYLKGGVDVFDQGQVTLERLLGYKLVIWSGLDRPGEGLTDADVSVLASLHSLGKSVYLIGPRIASDTGRLSPEGRLQFERLCGLEPAGAAVSTVSLECQAAVYGDPICAGRLGVVAREFTYAGIAEPGRLTTTNGFQTKVTLAGAPVMVVTPPVGDPDLGSGRLATQTFGLGGNAQSQRVFMNTVLWLLRAWYCENFSLLLTAVETPVGGRVGEELVYEYRVQHGGACGALGVVISEELPASWSVKDVELPGGSWRLEGAWLSMTLGGLDDGADQVVRVRLQAARPGTFTHTVRVRAEALAFVPASHQVASTTVIEGQDLAPRLELRPALQGSGYVLWLFGSAGTNYRIQESADLRDWRDVGSTSGPEAQFPVGAPDAGVSSRYLRALWP